MEIKRTQLHQFLQTECHMAYVAFEAEDWGKGSHHISLKIHDGNNTVILTPWAHNEEERAKALQDMDAIMSIIRAARKHIETMSIDTDEQDTSSHP
jgi:CRISPR/Cas system CMR-associated protein Cmr5 small subunit